MSPAAAPVIAPLDPQTPQALHLLACSDAYLGALYPAESNHLESADSLARPNVHFVGVWLDGRLAGCGAVKVLQDDTTYGEIKRVFVLPEHRGRGLSHALMDALEAHLTAQGILLARLETGIHQPEALALYRARGYRTRLPFGQYQPDPLSVFMEKALR